MQQHYVRDWKLLSVSQMLTGSGPFNSSCCWHCALGSQIVLQVHRYHPPLVYGRSMDSNPEASEGCAMYAARKGPTGSPTFAVITYRCAFGAYKA